MFNEHFVLFCFSFCFVFCFFFSLSHLTYYVFNNWTGGKGFYFCLIHTVPLYMFVSLRLYNKCLFIHSFIDADNKTFNVLQWLPSKKSCQLTLLYIHTFGLIPLTNTNECSLIYWRKKKSPKIPLANLRLCEIAGPICKWAKFA